MSQPKVPSSKMPGKSLSQMGNYIPDITLNPLPFDQLIKAQGLKMIHARPVPCPNVRDINGSDHNPACTQCYNGFYYYGEKEFVGAFMGNDGDKKVSMNGSWDYDQATIIVPVKDQSGDILDVQFFDQIIIPDVTVRYYQRVEHSQSGLDRLQFPAKTIDFVIDASGKRYRPGVDVIVQEGRLRWIGDRPGYDAMLDRGVVYSVNYYTRPAFTIIGLPHQIRAVQTQGPDGNNVQARFPQLCAVRKDFLPFDRTDHVGEKDAPEPKSGSFI